MSILGASSAPIPQDTAVITKTDSLQEVIVTAEKVKYDAEGYQLNIATIPQLQTMHLAEMIHFLPGMVVDGTKMKVFGNQVAIIYINDKRINLSGEELQDYLSTIDGKNIRSIKVIESAGAEISAQSAGLAILRIKTKHTEDGGTANFNFNANEKFDGRGMSPHYNIEYRSGRWSFNSFGDYSNNHNIMKRRTLNYYEDSQTNLQNNSSKTINNYRYSLSAGIAYDITPQDYIAIDGGLSVQRFNNKGQFEELREQLGMKNERYQISSLTQRHEPSSTISTQYCHEWATGKASISGYGHWFKTDQKQHQTSNDKDIQWQTNSETKSHRHLLGANADITQQLPEKWGKLRTGGTISIWRNRDDTTDDHFLYQEKTAAVFAGWDWDYKKLNTSLGLRYEHKSINAKTIGGTDNKHIYNELFPNVRINYTFDTHRGHSLRINAQRRYQLPQMLFMNPFVNWESDYSYSTGNPHLLPAFGKSFAAHLTLWRFYSLKATYNSSEDFINVYEKETDTDIYYTTYRNGVKKHGWEFVASAMIRLSRKGVINLTAQQQLHSIRYLQQKVHNRQRMISVSFSHQLPYNINLRFSGSYYSPSQSLCSKDLSRFSGNTGINRSFMKDALNVSLNYSINSQNESNIQIERVQSNSKTNSSIHRITISARYQLKWGNKNARIRKQMMENTEINR